MSILNNYLFWQILDVHGQCLHNCETQPPSSIGWVALSSVFVQLLSRIGNTSSHLHYMMFQTIQTIYFLWGYDPGNMSVSFIAELSPVYCCLLSVRTAPCLEALPPCSLPAHGRRAGTRSKTHLMIRRLVWDFNTQVRSSLWTNTRRLNLSIELSPEPFAVHLAAPLIALLQARHLDFACTVKSRW